MIVTSNKKDQYILPYDDQMDFIEAITNYNLGYVAVSQLPEIAIRALDEGYSSESLCHLGAMTSQDNPQQLKIMFEESLYELLISTPSLDESIEKLLTFYVKKFLRKEINAYKLSKIIYYKFNDYIHNEELLCQPYLKDLAVSHWVFEELEDLIQESPDKEKKRYRLKLIDEQKKFLELAQNFSKEK